MAAARRNVATDISVSSGKREICSSGGINNNSKTQGGVKGVALKHGAARNSMARVTRIKRRSGAITKSARQHALKAVITKVAAASAAMA